MLEDPEQAKILKTNSLEIAEVVQHLLFLRRLKSLSMVLSNFRCHTVHDPPTLMRTNVNKLKPTDTDHTSSFEGSGSSSVFSSSSISSCLVRDKICAYFFEFFFLLVVILSDDA